MTSYLRASQQSHVMIQKTSGSTKIMADPFPLIGPVIHYQGPLLVFSVKEYQYPRRHPRTSSLPLFREQSTFGTARVPRNQARFLDYFVSIGAVVKETHHDESTSAVAERQGSQKPRGINAEVGSFCSGDSSRRQSRQQAGSGGAHGYVSLFA